MTNLPFKHLIIYTFVLMGILGSVWEYKNWKKEEMAKYGQGWENTKSLKYPETLIGPYINDKLRFRIRYPKNWLIEEDKKLTTFVHPQNPSILFSVKPVSTSLNFPDYVDSLTKDEIRDREYVNIGETNLVILTFYAQQKILVQKGQTLLMIEANTPHNRWNEYELTFKEIYKSLVIF